MMLDVPLVQILAGYLSYKLARGQAGIPGYIFNQFQSYEIWLRKFKEVNRNNQHTSHDATIPLHF